MVHKTINILNNENYTLEVIVNRRLAVVFDERCLGVISGRNFSVFGFFKNTFPQFQSNSTNR